MSLRSLGLNRSLFGNNVFTAKSVHSVLDFKKLSEPVLSKIMTRTDSELGGKSTASFTVDPLLGIGRFSGSLNLDLPKDNPKITRSGYAMFRTVDQHESWLSGSSYWDWSNMSLLVMRVRGDRRKYLVNLQANTPMPTDLFQHRLFLNYPGQWETVVIPLNDFVMTNWGEIQDGGELNKAEVKTLGVGLLDKTYGPFLLEFEWIKAMSVEEVEKITLADRSAKLAVAAPTESEAVKNDLPGDYTHHDPTSDAALLNKNDKGVVDATF